MKLKLLLFTLLVSKLTFSQWNNLNLMQDINSSIVLNGNTLYAATENGVYYTDLDNINWIQSSDIQDKGLNFYQNSSEIFLTSYEKVYKSSNEGVDWSVFYENTTLNQDINNIIKDDINFVLGMNGNGMYFSVDDGQNWNSSGSSWQSKNTAIIKLGQTLYTSYHSSGNMQKSQNFGETWSSLPSSYNNGLTFPFTGSYPDIKSLNLMNNSVLLAGVNETFDSGSQSGVFFSYDNGENWEKRNNGLDNIYVESVVTIGNLIFAGTEGGVFYSTDEGGNWQEFNEGLTNLSVKKLDINNVSLFASTNNSIFSTDVCSLLQNSSTIYPAGTVDLSEGEEVTLEANLGGVSYQWFRDDVEIPNSNSNVYNPTESGSYKVLINYSSTCSDISNITVVNFENLSVVEQEKQTVTKLFPNPSKHFIQLSNQVEAMNYKVFNNLGQMVKNGVLLVNEKIDIQKLPSGIYILKFENGTYLKFIKE